MAELEIPKLIWLQFYGDGNPEWDDPVDMDEAYWCAEKVNEHDVEYIKAELFDKYGGHTADCHSSVYVGMGSYRECNCGFAELTTKRGKS